MSNAEDIRDCVFLRGDKFKTGHLKKLAIWITEVNGVHEAAVDRTCILNAKFL